VELCDSLKPSGLRRLIATVRFCPASESCPTWTKPNPPSPILVSELTWLDESPRVEFDSFLGLSPKKTLLIQRNLKEKTPKRVNYSFLVLMI